MTTKIKTNLILGLFIFLLTTSIKSQEKYEFAVIDYIPSYKQMEISINGTEYKKVKVEKNEIKGDGDVSVALKEVKKMGDEGWEVFNTNTTAGSTLGFKAYIFYLRRKIK